MPFFKKLKREKIKEERKEKKNPTELQMPNVWNFKRIGFGLRGRGWDDLGEWEF